MEDYEEAGRDTVRADKRLLDVHAYVVLRQCYMLLDTQTGAAVTCLAGVCRDGVRGLRPRARAAHVRNCDACQSERHVTRCAGIRQVSRSLHSLPRVSR
jgi:hypothetical protein